MRIQNKKTFALIIVISLMMTLLTGCACEHQWHEATCSSPKTCEKCGEISGDVLSHEWKSATCTTPQTCEKCGAIEGTALQHSWSEATIQQPSECINCGAVGESLNLREFGFYNMNNITLVSITGYSENENCVYSKSKTNVDYGEYYEEYSLQNRYLTIKRYYYPAFYVEGGSYDPIQLRRTKTEGTYQYSIINNNQITYSGELLIINERVVLEDNILILKGQIGDRETWFAIKEQLTEPVHEKTEGTHKVSGAGKRYNSRFVFKFR